LLLDWPTTELVSEDTLAGLAARRHQVLIERLQTVGTATVEELADHVGVTPQTIRKDLNYLSDQQLLSRVRGGALLKNGLDNLAYASRQSIASEAKERIGEAAAQLIPDNVSVFINIGTTTEAVARHLRHRQRLMVVTNNLNVADILANDVDVIVAGGKVRASDRAVVGAMAVDFIRSFKVDYAVIGTSALDEAGDLLDFDIDEIKVSQTIIDNARQVILVSDASKVGRLAPARIASMADIDVFVTDEMDNEALMASCERHNVRVVITG